MKLFLKRILIFSIVPLALLAGLYIYLRYSFNKTYDHFKLNSSVKTVFIGDSHVQYAINDSLLQDSKNLSQSSESFYFSYFKLKKLLSKNPTIQQVYLGFSYHSLSKYYEDYIDGEHSAAVSAQHFFNLPIREQLSFVRLHSSMASSYLKTIVTNSSKVDWGYNNDFSLTRISYPSVRKRLDYQFYNNSGLKGISEINSSYFKKIVALCKNRQVELILLNTPLHNYYKEQIPQFYKDQYSKILTVECSDLKILDLSDLVLSDDCYAPDGDHLSSKGAFILAENLLEHFASAKNILK